MKKVKKTKGGGLLETNNQLERFTKDKRNKKIMYSILGILLIIGSITLYKTFAFYEEKKSFNVLKGRIPNFTKSNLILALTLDGKEVDTYPSKGEYKVDVICDNEAIGRWDYKEWSIYVSNLKSKTINCQIDFKTKYQENLLNGANPVLKEELIPVKIESNGSVTYADVTMEWYNYAEKQWANAVILLESAKSKYKVGDTISESDIESYFVWIPKYAYKIQSLGVNTTQAPFEIKFGTTNTVNNDTECVTPNASGENGSCAVGKYMTHPAFTSFGDVKGLWVGKFETGYKGSTDTASSQKNENNSSKVQIKPNVHSWRSINVSNAFKTSYGYKRELDSHMMKNTEWGAVAYLTNSIYGKCIANVCEEIYINNHSSYITGWSGKSLKAAASTNGYSFSDKNSVNASNTGNYSGIYDLSGGSEELVAGVRGSLTSSSSAGFSTGDTFNTKYYDVYSTSRNSYTDYTTRILGDATAETKGWNSNFSYYIFSSNPWFARGGNAGSGSSVGLFFMSHNPGWVQPYYGFRLVLAF